MRRTKSSLMTAAVAGSFAAVSALAAANPAHAAAPLVRAIQGVLPVTVPLFMKPSRPTPPPWTAAAYQPKPLPKITPELMFGLFDANSDGSLDREEFIALRSHGLGRLTMVDWLSRLDPAAAFALVDCNYDGWVGWNEFAAWERMKR